MVYGNELKKIVHVLRQLPHLSRIEMSRSVLFMYSHRRQGANKHWSWRKGISHSPAAAS